MGFQAPHWLTATVAVIGAACGGIVTAGVLPAYSGVFGAIAGICALLAAPTVTK